MRLPNRAVDSSRMADERPTVTLWKVLVVIFVTFLVAVTVATIVKFNV